jgi:hypothetical protein
MWLFCIFRFLDRRNISLSRANLDEAVMVRQCRPEGISPKGWLGIRSSARLLCPHAPGDGVFFGADGIGVDGGRGELDVSEPFLDEVEGDAYEDGAHAKPCQRRDGTSSGHARPGPEALAAACRLGPVSSRMPYTRSRAPRKAEGTGADR